MAITAARGRHWPMKGWSQRWSARDALGLVGLALVIALMLAPAAWREAVLDLVFQRAAASAPAPTAASGLDGPARVIDGDTLEINGERVRLYGVDAFERDQTCGAGASTWYCGLAGADALTRRLDGRTLACEPMDTDRYGRIVARCRTGGEDIGAWMVERGMALAYREYSLDYVEAEDRARAARLGVWRTTTFTAPQDWRAAR